MEGLPGYSVTWGRWSNLGHSTFRPEQIPACSYRRSRISLFRSSFQNAVASCRSCTRLRNVAWVPAQLASMWPADDLWGASFFKLEEVHTQDKWTMITFTQVFTAAFFFFHNSQKVETIQTSTNWWINKTWYICTEENYLVGMKCWFKLQRRWNLEHTVLWNKPGTKGHILYDSISIKCYVQASPRTESGSGLGCGC